MNDPLHTADVLSQLQRLHVTTAIDDFGTGSTSLSHLRSFSVSLLKIDRPLVATLLSDRASHDVIEQLLSLGRNWKIEVAAQGNREDRTMRSSQGTRMHVWPGIPLLCSYTCRLSNATPSRPSCSECRHQSRALNLLKRSHYFPHARSKNRYRSLIPSFSAAGDALKCMTCQPFSDT
jgi:hypothetical protein